MSAVNGTVLEVGPVAVRAVPERGPTIPAERVAAALAGIDDTVVLVDERPVQVAALWRSIIESVAGSSGEALTVVHPSWWSRPRVARILEAARTVSPEVVALPRSQALTDGRATAVVEIAADVVAVGAAVERITVRCRPISAAEVARLVDIDSSARVVIDAPAGVPDAEKFAGAVRDALRRRGAAVESIRLDDVVVSRPAAEPATVTARPPRPWAPLVAAAAVAITLCAVGRTAPTDGTGAPAASPAAVGLAEGRVTMLIPRGWRVARITVGPGSRRVQISSPTDPSAALQLTQSYAPGENLDTTAEVLRRAIGEQPSGVFVDFDGGGRNGGRPAVTYREVRAGRDIRWSVFLDGSTRISVGCQSAAGREGSITAECEQAVSSARESMGTATQP
ncbi:type VII secretion-associated protein [Mycolicibacterium sp. CBM1]